MADSQELRQYIFLFLRWWWLILICALLGGGAAWAYSLRVVPEYTATVTLLVQRGGTSADTLADYYNEQLALTYSQMIKGRPVMVTAISGLGLDMTPEDLAETIKISVVPDTGLIRLSVTDVDPNRAAAIANTVADAFIAQNRGMQQERYIDYLGSVQEQMAEMSTLIEQTTTAISALGTPITDQEHAELARLETTLAGYRNTYATLSNSYEQMRLTAALSTDNVVVFEAALPPIEADGGNAVRNTALAAVVGAMLAAGIVFLIEYLDDTLKTPLDVEEALGLNTLGSIGQIGRGQNELVVIDYPRSPIAEAYRALRTNVRFSSLDRPLHTLLVTSPGVTEGKSVTVANLSVAMAQAGLRVATVDADLRRPRQHRIFDLERSEGLSESLLTGQMDGALCPVETVEGLLVLPSGDLPPNPAEMLGSQRLQDLLDELAGQVDVVILDSPPLLPVTDAAVLAQRVDGVVLVVEAGSTRRTVAQHAVETLRQVNAHILGVVLNAVPMRKAGYYYYYHEYYGGDGQRRERRRKKKGLAGRASRLRRQRAGGRNRGDGS